MATRAEGKRNREWTETMHLEGRLMQQWRENGPQSPAKQEAAENKRRWFRGLHGNQRITLPPRRRR